VISQNEYFVLFVGLSQKVDLGSRRFMMMSKSLIKETLVVPLLEELGNLA